jgi:putative inorganic carbon (HCO3(-)) transporter
MSRPPTGRHPVDVDQRAVDQLDQPAATDRQDGASPRSAVASKTATLLVAVAIPVVLGAAVAVTAKPTSLALAGIAGIVGLVAALASPRWALVGTLFLLIGYLPDVVGAHKLASAALPMLIVVAVLVRHVTGAERVTIRGDTKWFAFFGVALVLATATAGQRSTSDLSDFVGFALFAAAMFILVDSPLWLRRAIWAVVAGAAMLAALSVLQQITKSYGQTFGGLAVVTPDTTGMRSGGPLSPGYFAQTLVATAALAAYLAVSARGVLERVIAIGATAAMLVAVLYTQARGPMLAIVVAGIAAALLRGVPVSKVVIAAVVVAIGGLLVLPSAVQHRIGDLTTVTEGGSSPDSSLRGRFAENLAAVDAFRDHQFLGVGPDNFELQYLKYAQNIGLDSRAEVRGAHNLYLESLAEVGIIGSIPFFALLWMGLRRAWQARVGTDRSLGLLAEGCFVAWLAFLVAAITLHLSYPRYLWIFLALAFTAGQLRNRAPA